MKRFKESFVAAAVVLVGTTAGTLLPVQSGESYMPPGATTEDYRRALSKQKERSIIIRESYHLPEKTATTPTKTQLPPTVILPADGVSAHVYFPFDSAELTPRAKSELDNLGKALASPEFAGDRWLIEGHTDAVGSSHYNQTLSLRRAESVRRYMIEKHGVKSRRLEALGKGETDLIDSENPRSDKNRRVRINYLGG